MRKTFYKGKKYCKRSRRIKNIKNNIFVGGYGPASYQGTPALDGTVAYPYYNIMGDPNTPSYLTDSRQFSDMSSAGGKKRNLKKMRKTRKQRKRAFRKKMFGGDPLSFSSASDGPTTVSGAFDSANIIAGNDNPNTAAYSQPVQQMYSNHHVPLV